MTSTAPAKCAYVNGWPIAAAMTAAKTGVRFMKSAAPAAPSLCTPSFHHVSASVVPNSAMYTSASASSSGRISSGAGARSSASTISSTAPISVLAPVVCNTLKPRTNRPGMTAYSDQAPLAPNINQSPLEKRSCRSSSHEPPLTTQATPATPSSRPSHCSKPIGRRSKAALSAVVIAGESARISAALTAEVRCSP